MKIDNSGYLFKAILLTACGILLTFFPGVLAWVFYIIGGIIIIGSLLTGLTGGEGGALFSVGMVGAGIGLFIMYLPKLISSHIAVIAGMVLVIVGIVQIVKSRKKDLSNGMRNVQLVFGILLLVAGIFFMFNPFHASKIIRILTGVLLLLFAAFNYYVVHVINQRNAGNSGGSSSYPDIIDASGVEKPDEINKRIE
ncbi:DUF308 domain-containing protein [Ruminococcus sp.]|uniref:DUF308 domain-containing protein n=1 Tax=Ruminococcus sp. TaxID=41978 RepID=UPI002BA68F04|nr:DUF308 domain-containing protein [Ruminococcus sp.]HNZ98197.1 DUF308 domain-containing protein [Ruminococcus sp.]HOH87139.1 DUF308 domain-containing protein [Ruminococcus sp.]